MELNIIFEDNNILVVNKIAGQVVNISETSPKDTLQHDVIKYLKLPEPGSFERPDLPEDEVWEEASDFVKRSGIVHRLDKDTSGVLMIAKTPETFEKLQAQFKDRQVKKEYTALVFGRINDDKVHIDAPVARDPKNRLRFAISRSGKPAVTNIVRLNENQIDDLWLTSVNVYPVTGRTHQIRIHMLALNSPVVGDVIYSGKGRLRWAEEHGFTRLMLHSVRIGIQYLEEEYSWYEAELPQEFHDFV